MKRWAKMLKAVCILPNIFAMIAEGTLIRCERDTLILGFRGCYDFGLILPEGSSRSHQLARSRAVRSSHRRPL
jgi:hypothetical protein